MKNSSNAEAKSGDESYEEEDQKPPAQEIRVVKRTNPDDDDSPDQSNRTMPTTDDSGEASLASSTSTSFSALVGGDWVSPVARAMPENDTSRTGMMLHHLNNNSKPIITPRSGKRLGFPLLTAATPCSPNEDDADSCANAVIKITKPLPAETTTTTTRFEATLQPTVYLWMATVALCVAVFVYQILPSLALATLLFMFASMGMLTQAIVQTARQWYRETIVTGNGLGRWLLPESLYRTLVETSLHEFMVDPTFGLENRHMLLYFLPLTDEQLNDSIQRLAPAHRNRLLRPGMGHILLGESLMRLLLGEPRYHQWLQQQQEHSQTSPMIGDGNNNNHNTSIAVDMASPPARQRLLLTDDDDASDLGLDIAADDVIGGLNQQQAVSMAQRLGLETSTITTAMMILSPQTVTATAPITTPTSTVAVVASLRQQQVRRLENNSTATADAADSLSEDYADQELQVLVDAFWGSAYGSVWNPIRDYVSNALILPTVDTASRFGARTGMLLSLSAGSAGLWGWWTGVYALPTWWSLSSLLSSANRAYNSRVRGQHPNHLPPSWSLWTTALVGGMSLGVSLYARHYYVRQQVLTIGKDNSAVSSEKKKLSQEYDKKDV